MTFPAKTTITIHVLPPETIILKVTGALQSEHCSEFARALDELCARPQRKKAIDLSQATYMASAAIGVLMLRQKMLVQSGEEIRIWGCGKHLRERFELINLDHLFEILPKPPSYPSAPESQSPLTVQRLKGEAEQYLQAPEWSLWVYKQLTYVEVHGNVSIAAADNCLSETWGIFLKKKDEYDRVFLLLNTNAMPMQTTNFRHFLQREWAFALDLPEYTICLIEGGAMKRIIWEATFKLLGKQETIKVCPNAAAALRWVEKLIPASGANGSAHSRGGR